MKELMTFLLVAEVMCAVSQAQSAPPLYQNDFEKAEPGKVPDEMVVLDGAFAVKQEGDNKFLELPGAPLESFGVLFGPAKKEGLAVSARAYGTAHGRRFPTFAVGLDGVAGYRLQVSPAKRRIELFRGDTVQTSVPYLWTPGEWTCLRLQIRQVKPGEWKVEGRVWPAGEAEPTHWMIKTEETAHLPEGRPSIFASPFSGTPIRFDDLLVTEAR